MNLAEFSGVLNLLSFSLLSAAGALLGAFFIWIGCLITTGCIWELYRKSDSALLRQRMSTLEKRVSMMESLLKRTPITESFPGYSDHGIVGQYEDSSVHEDK